MAMSRRCNPTSDLSQLTRIAWMRTRCVSVLFPLRESHHGRYNKIHSHTHKASIMKVVMPQICLADIEGATYCLVTLSLTC